ncbi:hypothetical protein F4810DRAFT_665922 [Camillea tinctor]|nr:hypothetical protein F4810DRAFT_665922 [Camillea tinctor]
MADPIGVLGTAVGVVSLGIQVGGALKEYIGDFRSRGEHVDGALARVKVFEEALGVINTAITAFENEHRIPSARAISCLQICRTELMAFKSELQRHETTTQKDAKGKMKEIKKKFGYPFHRKQLVELEDRIHQISQTLSLAVEALELNALSALHDKTASLQHMTQTNAATLASLSASSNTLGLEQAATNARLTLNQSTLYSMSDGIMNINSQMSTSFFDTNDRIQHAVTDTTSRIDSLHAYTQSSNEKQTEVLTEIHNMLQVLTSTTPLSDGDLLRRRLAVMVTSKPSLLKDVRETAGSLEVSPQLNSPIGPQAVRKEHYATDQLLESLEPLMMCGCHRHRRTTRSSARWGSVVFFAETISGARHRPWCPRAKGHIDEQQRTIGINYYCLRWLTSMAVSASLKLSYGAGGYSISPVLRYFATIDRYRSPAFRIFRLVEGADVRTSNKSFAHAESMRRLIMHATTAIRRVYQNHAAMPTDVTQDGNTLLEEACMARLSRDVFYTLVLELSDLGIPSRSAITKSYDTFLPRNPITNVEVDLVSRVHFAANVQWEISNPLIYIRYEDCIRSSRLLPIVFGLDHPILFALIQKDEPKLRRLLQEHPTIFVQHLIDYYQWSVFLVALNWAVGLNILMSMNLYFSEYIKGASGKALSDVVGHSKPQCSKCPGVPQSSFCDYADAFVVLLNHGCELNIHFVGGFENLRPCQCCYIVLLRHIREWRQKLRSLAQTHLREEDQHRNGIWDTKILDAKASKIVAILEDKGISPYSLFGIRPGDYRLSSRHARTESVAIYHDLNSKHAAQLAFEMGFQDVDVPFHGLTPLMIKGSGSRPAWDFCLWLIDRGADCTRPFPLDFYYRKTSPRYGKDCPPRSLEPIPKRTMAHQLSRPNRNLRVKGEENSFRLLQVSLLSLESGDGCNCGCSSSSRGCSMLTMYLNEFHDVGFIRYHTLEYIQNCLSFVTSIADDSGSPALVEDVIRALTFHRLRIRHTCCSTVYWKSFILDDEYGDDFAELRDEDHDHLVQLEELVAESMDEFTQYGGSLESFIRGPWEAKMDKVDRESRESRLSQKEISSIKSLGVRLDIVDEEDSRDDQCRIDYTRRNKIFRYKKDPHSFGPTQFRSFEWQIDAIASGKA